jgi:hypothetical protein
MWRDHSNKTNTQNNVRRVKSVGRLNRGYTNILAVFFVLALAFFISCAPTTFVQTTNPGWNTVQVRDDLSYDQAWKSVVDLMAQRFDLEIMSKEDGYLRTAWSHSWTGEVKENYKVRAIIKFAPSGRSLEVKSEAQYRDPSVVGMGGGWKMGTDEVLTHTLRTDIMGKVGSVAQY